MVAGSSPRAPEELLAGPRIATEQDVQLVRLLLKESGRQVESEVSGVSMGSAVPIGSRIRIRHCGERIRSPGQVVAFLSGTRVVVHRVIYAGTRGAAGDFLITQGDADWLCDPPVRIDVVAGCVDEFSLGAEWQRIGRSQASALQRIVCLPARVALCLALEVSPALAIALSRGMMSFRTRMRRMLGRFRTSNPGNVRT